MRTAIYLRLSRSDGDLGEDDKDESNSIENQRLLLKDYISHNEEFNGEVLEYVDDGYTGTNFRRPGFMSMLEDAKKGKIDTIIVKDLSRIGRNYIDVGDYLEQIFPTLGVRVIAVNSYYDSKEHEGDVIGLDVAISNIINNMYSTDLSKKVKSGFRSKWKQGISTKSSMPYGYRWNPETREKWIVDEEAAEVVRLIFERAASGCSLRMIADELNEKKIETPNRYHRRKGTKNYYRKVSDKEDLWNVEQLRDLIRNRGYIGVDVNHVREYFNTGIKVKRIPESEWYIQENAHTPIISKEVFDKAQDIIKTVNKGGYRIPNEFVLKGKIRCGTCKLAMFYRVNTYGEKCYCRHTSSSGRYSKCYKGEVPLKHIEDIVYRTIKGYYKDLVALEGILNDTISETHLDYKKKVSNAKAQIDILRQERIRQYEAYAAGQITAEAYMKKKEKLTEEIDNLTKERDRLKDFVSYDDDLNDEVKRLKGTVDTEGEKGKLTKKMVDAFVDTIYVYDKDRIEIKIKCEDLINEAVTRQKGIMEGLLVGDREDESTMTKAKKEDIKNGMHDKNVRLPNDHTG